MKIEGSVSKGGGDLNGINYRYHRRIMFDGEGLPLSNIGTYGVPHKQVKTPGERVQESPTQWLNRYSYHRHPSAKYKIRTHHFYFDLLCQGRCKVTCTVQEEAESGERRPAGGGGAL